MLPLALNPSCVPPPARTKSAAVSSFARPSVWWTVAGCAVILFARRPDMVLNPQFWAEDGPVFFSQARAHGAAALLAPSAGYYHTLLRCVAWVAAHFDPLLAPAIFVAAAGVFTLYVAALTQSPRFMLPSSAGYALAIVLVPDAREVLLNLTNLQWIFAAGLLAVLLCREAETVWQRAHDFAAVAALGLTGPFSIAFLPLFAWRALRRRTRFSAQLAAVVAVAAAFQAIAIARAGTGLRWMSLAYEFIAAIPGRRVGSSLLSGGLADAHFDLPVATALGVYTVAAIVALARARGPARLERLWLACAFVGLLAMAFYRCHVELDALYFGAGSRYFFLPQLIALWLLVAAAKGNGPWVAWICRAALAASVALNLPRLREPPLDDLNWPAFATRIRAGEAVTVRINPDWNFTLPGRHVLPANASPAPRALVNVSARGVAGPDAPMIVGFVIESGAPRQFLVRAVGGSLRCFGVAQPLEHPLVSVLGGEGGDTGFVAVRSSQLDPALIAAAAKCGAFALDASADDAAGLAVLGHGKYSVVVSGADRGRGTVLVEIYEVPAASAESPKLP